MYWFRLKNGAYFLLSDADVEQIGRWCYSIEKHYNQSMDIEWAKDGITGELYILQARPETVHSQTKSFQLKSINFILKEPHCAKGNPWVALLLQAEWQL